MKGIRVFWGLLVDDPRLAAIVAVTLLASLILSRLHLYRLAAFAIILGLVLALFVSVEYELRKKLRA